VPPTEHKRVLVVGDLQRTSVLEAWRERNEVQQKMLIRQAAHEALDAVVLLGDQVFWGCSEDDWGYFDALIQPIRDQGISVFPILGNHEYFGWTAGMLTQAQQRFPNLTEGPRQVVMDSVAWLLLNTNYRDIGMKAMSRQHTWFVRRLRSLDSNASVKAVIVCGHHPPFTNSMVVDDDEILQSYFVAPFIQSKKTAIWFSGHCHAYERFEVGGKHFIVSEGGGGPRHRLFRGILQQQPDLYEGEIVRPFHYCLVTRDANALQVEMVPLGRKRSEADTLRIALSQR
jgi:Icc-related predicted phosphoesterase